ncbi:NIN-like protein [Tanacetum coccineum]
MISSTELYSTFCKATPTSVVAASNEPVVTTNITHDRTSLVFHQQEQTNLSDELAQFKKTMREQFIENATASAVKKLTIKATYKENMVKFPFMLLDGLEKLKEMVATRYQLKLGSFKLKYVDEDDDMILIACDTDLMLLIGDPGQPINQHATKLLVLPIAHA